MYTTAAPPSLALIGTFQLVKWSPGELLVAGQWMSCAWIISLVCDHNTTSDTLLKMGERLQSQKSFVCTFFDCKAKFSKSWKLEAHLCKHTGLVSAGGMKRRGCCECCWTACRLSLWWQKPFSCESCGKSFCTRYQLTRHELNHSGERPHKWAAQFPTLDLFLWLAHVLVFRCLAEGCPEAFVTHSSMKNHMARVHHKRERPYQVRHSCPVFLFCSVSNLVGLFLF